MILFFVVSNNPVYTLYNLTFSDVGQGAGNYILNTAGLNGNVYTWIAPVSGVKQGQFEAAEFLVTPKTQQIITGGVDYKISKETMMTADFARSRYDIIHFRTWTKAMMTGARLKLL